MTDVHHAGTQALSRKQPCTDGNIATSSYHSSEMTPVTAQRPGKKQKHEHNGSDVTHRGLEPDLKWFDPALKVQDGASAFSVASTGTLNSECFDDSQPYQCVSTQAGGTVADVTVHDRQASGSTEQVDIHQSLELCSLRDHHLTGSDTPCDATIDDESGDSSSNVDLYEYMICDSGSSDSSEDSDDEDTNNTRGWMEVFDNHVKIVGEEAAYSRLQDVIDWRLQQERKGPAVTGDDSASHFDIARDWEGHAQEISGKFATLADIDWQQRDLQEEDASDSDSSDDTWQPLRVPLMVTEEEFKLILNARKKTGGKI